MREALTFETDMYCKLIIRFTSNLSYTHLSIHLGEKKNSYKRDKMCITRALYCLLSGTFLPYFFVFILFHLCSLYLFTLCKNSEQILYSLYAVSSCSSLPLCTLLRHTIHTVCCIVHLYSEFEIENDSNNSDQIECDMGAHTHTHTQYHYITIECDGVSSHL